MKVKDEGIAVGQIVAAWGLEGAVRVYPTTDFPERLVALRHVWLGSLSGPRLEVTESRWQGTVAVMRFASVHDRTAAERLRGRQLVVPRQELPPLPEGQYYWFQLVGLEVYTANPRRRLGRVTRMVRTGAHDLFEVDRGADQPPLLIPALKQVVRQVNLEGGSLEVELPAGLEEVF
jgi:16S rRNA processing protein RimM